MWPTKFESRYGAGADKVMVFASEVGCVIATATKATRREGTKKFDQPFDRRRHLGETPYADPSQQVQVDRFRTYFHIAAAGV
jgi:hypothetical protein